MQRPWSRRYFMGVGLVSVGLGVSACRRGVSPEAPTQPSASAVDFSALAGFCRDALPIAAPELLSRQQQARAICRDHEIDALICEAGTSLRYFTGVRWGQSERPLLWILPVRGEPFFVGPAFEAGTLAEQIGDPQALVAWEEHESPYAVAFAALAKHTLARVVVDPEARLFVVEGLRGAAGSVAVTVDPGVIQGARIRKSAAELALLRRANEATQAAIAAALKTVRVGDLEAEIGARVHAAQAAAGLSDTWALVLAGPNAAFPHGTRDERALIAGDMLLIDTGGALHGYRSDITRTAFVGEVAAAPAKAWRAVQAAQAAAFERLRPGAIAGDVDAAARAVIEAAGFGAGYHAFSHRLGHGIGLQVHEAPYLVGGAATAMEPGMVMSVEPGIYVPEGFGVRLEDIVAITSEGLEIFGAPATSPPIAG